MVSMFAIKFLFFNQTFSEDDYIRFYFNCNAAGRNSESIEESWDCYECSNTAEAVRGAETSTTY